MVVPEYERDSYRQDSRVSHDETAGFDGLATGSELTARTVPFGASDLPYRVRWCGSCRARIARASWKSLPGVPVPFFFPGRKRYAEKATQNA